MRELEYPLDAELLIRKKKSIRRKLLSQEETDKFPLKKIAILGGYTTKNITLMLELFLLNQGIRSEFYESEYNRYFEDGMFGNQRLEEFQPDIIYICISGKNIMAYPSIKDSKEVVDGKIDYELRRYKELWTHISEIYHCIIIQNNFEYPDFRLLGNKDASDFHGWVNFITRLNLGFYNYAQEHENFFICDVNYLSASYGLDKWYDPYYWNMYKYAVSLSAIPYLAFNVSNIIKSLFGRNKKVLNLDLDNTLWGGVIGEDGADNIDIGQENAVAETYSSFQEYLRLLKDMGVLLTINSKNDNNVARSGLRRPDSVLTEDDFVSIRANWEPKSENLISTAEEMRLLPEAFVFVDDNPAEREIIRRMLPEVSVPEIKEAENYIRLIDRSGFFEATTLSSDDIDRTRMYVQNSKREHAKSLFTDYHDYLLSLEMRAEIKPFAPEYMARISQLTNKSNQFNLTTRRCTQSEIERMSKSTNFITLYGRLEDKFGDNGVVSVVTGEIREEEKEELHIILWLMSCRVLKRDMEFAMMDELAKTSKKMGIIRIIGYYYPTIKNVMVKDLYNDMGFNKVSEDDEGNTIWVMELGKLYKEKQDVIVVNGGDTDE